MDFRLAPDYISAIRFRISPGHELSHAIRVLQRPDDQPLQWGWLRGVRDGVPREAFELMAVIIGADGYFPDFLTATPSWDMGPDDEVRRLRTVPPEVSRADLTKMLARSSGHRQKAIARMMEHPGRATGMIADAWLDFGKRSSPPYGRRSNASCAPTSPCGRAGSRPTASRRWSERCTSRWRGTATAFGCACGCTANSSTAVAAASCSCRR